MNIGYNKPLYILRFHHGVDEHFREGTLLPNERGVKL
jgi:hypothetical protein